MGSPREFPFRGVVIVADLLPTHVDTPVHLRHDLEQTDQFTLLTIQEALRKLDIPFVHYESPRDLAINAANHNDDIVISLFGGAYSRNRMALVPAVCETFGLAYVGADVYARMICQDKEVSKAVARHAGLSVASHRIVRAEEDIKRALDLPLPCVVKPLWEGSSIGIGPDNLIKTQSEGESVIMRLLHHFRQPIMVETFIPGREVSWCFIERGGHERIQCFVEVVWKNDPLHFYTNLYDVQHKVDEHVPTVRPVNSELIESDRIALDKLLRFIGKVGYGRVDGRLSEGRFVFIEITPDAWLGSTGSFISSFRSLGLSVEEIILRVALSAQQDPPDR